MDQVLSSYKPGAEIARGAFATVFSCTHKASKKKFALKVVDKKVDDNDQEGQLRELFLLSEVEILKGMRHPNIVGFEEFFELPTAYALVMELVPGGELFERLVEKEFYSEVDARRLMSVLLGAMAHVHSKGVAHRDLKPENLVLADKQSDTNVKIIDFGLAKQLSTPDNYMRTVCGTPEYCAPELLKGYPYKMSVDVYAMGVIAFLLISGYHPFKRYRHKDGTLRDDYGRVVRRICRGTFEFHEELWGGVSSECKDVIAKMLEPDPEKRISVADALKHRWFDERLLNDSMLAGHDLSKSLIEIRDFNTKRRLRGAIHSVIGMQRMDKFAAAYGMDLPQPPLQPGQKPPPLPPRPPKLLGQNSQPDSLAASMHRMLHENDVAGAKNAGNVRILAAPTRRIVSPGVVEDSVHNAEAPAAGNGTPAAAAAAAAAAGAGGAAVGAAAATMGHRKPKSGSAVIEQGQMALETPEEESIDALKRKVAREHSLRTAAEARLISTQRAVSRIVSSSSSSAITVAAMAQSGGSVDDLDKESALEKEVNTSISQIMQGGDPAINRIMALEDALATEQQQTKRLAQQYAESQQRNEQVGEENRALTAQLRLANAEVADSATKAKRAQEQMQAFRDSEGLAYQLYHKLAIATGAAYRPQRGDAGAAATASSSNCCGFRK